MNLKSYQQRVLDSLTEFLGDCARSHDPAVAYQNVTAKVYGWPQPYVQIPDARFAKMPYVCMRVPTGGGKTLLACHAVGLAQNKLMGGQPAVALWLVPSNTILDQTADALRDARHPYRRALETECSGPVEVLTIEEALRVSRATVAGQTVVIVSTIQCFRTSDPEGRKVYDGDNGHMAEHMAAVTADRYGELDMGPDGKPKPSLINLLRWRRPLVIVDEAHNARTELSFATLADVRPSCILEFTATPDTKRSPSNVLHRVSAAELKAEHMVKLPLRVVTRRPDQRDQLLAEAIALRADLERLAALEAQATSEYIRPILLIQVERVDACEPLRERLVNEFGLARADICISVGKLDELKGLKPEIGDPGCAVRFVLTVEKLREGWDCPFAYVLCSLRDTRSATAIEQIVGRILRLPHAVPKRNEPLNWSFMFALTEGNQIATVLAELRDALVNNGFTRPEAETVILPATQPLMPLGSQPKTVVLPAGAMDAGAFRGQAGELAGKVRLDEASGAVTVFSPLTRGEEERLLSCVQGDEAKAAVADAVERVRQIERAFGGGEPRPPSPWERQLSFLVPLLYVSEDGTLFEFEKTHLIEHPWKLSAKNAALPDAYDPRQRPGLRTGSVDVSDDGEVRANTAAPGESDDFIGRLHQQVLGFDRPEDWTFDELVQWLDTQIEHRDIPLGESAEFLRKCLRGLMSRHGLQDVAALALDRFRLRDEVAKLVQAHRSAERRSAFQQWLLPESGLTVSPERGLDFARAAYEASWLYDGGHVFRNHYYGPKPGELRERKADGKLTEEFLCAQYLDDLPAVEYWVRNLSRKPSSFRLQTSTDYFYPDFVCRLKDGRILVVEYKGAHLYDGIDAEEKRVVGAVWEARSQGRCLFVMPEGKDLEAIGEKCR